MGQFHRASFTPLHISAVVEPDQLLNEAKVLASVLAQQAPLEMAATKRAVLERLDPPLSEALAVEKGEFVEVFGTEDANEGVAAFLAKRPLTWAER